jgi:CRP-like cAMP-binding protein
MTSYVPLKKKLNELTVLPEEQWKIFERFLSSKAIKKGGYFLRAGEDPSVVGMVTKGLFKAYYTTYDGKEFIRNFIPEGLFLAAYSVLLTQQPLSDISIQAIEDSEVITFEYKNYEALLKQHMCWQEIGRRLAELHYLLRELRQYQLLAYDAKTRYENFRKDYPQLLGRLSQQDIATYLGITPISFSRLKAKERPAKKS